MSRTGNTRALKSKVSIIKSSFCALLGVLALSVSISPCFAKEDAKNCQDHPLLTRIPGYWITACVQKQFDAFKFDTGKGRTQVEGQFWEIRYMSPPELTPLPSALQLLRNVENALKQVGGKVIATGSMRETLTLTKDGKELWIEAWADHTGKYILTIVQKEAMAQEITANADAFANGLKTSGHIAVEGILFDTGKATLKPESKQAIGEVIKLLKADAGLKVFVVGHTDNAGAVD